MSNISPEVQARCNDMVALRRDLHQHPELGFQETRTAGIVAERLRALGYTVRTGLGKTGVTGFLKGGRPGKTVLLRADIDALPIQEQTGAPYASRHPGAMHACGHDAHTAMALSAAEILAKDAPALGGNLFFVFQPAEEILIGAQGMLRDGALEGVTPDVGFAVHVMNRIPTGTIAVRSGPVMTSADKLGISVKGRGGHGANPHSAVDPVVAAAQVITALQTLVSRQTHPLKTAVLSITMLGLTPMRTSTFHWVTQVGLLTPLLVYVNAGIQLAEVDSIGDVFSPALIASLALLGAFPMLARKLLAILRRRVDGG